MDRQELDRLFDQRLAVGQRSDHFKFAMLPDVSAPMSMLVMQHVGCECEYLAMAVVRVRMRHHSRCHVLRLPCGDARLGNERRNRGQQSRGGCSVRWRK